MCPDGYFASVPLGRAPFWTFARRSGTVPWEGRQTCDGCDDHSLTTVDHFEVTLGAMPKIDTRLAHIEGIKREAVTAMPTRRSTGW